MIVAFAVFLVIVCAVSAGLIVSQQRRALAAPREARLRAALDAAKLVIEDDVEPALRVRITERTTALVLMADGERGTQCDIIIGMPHGPPVGLSARREGDRWLIAGVGGEATVLTSADPELVQVVDSDPAVRGAIDAVLAHGEVRTLSLLPRQTGADASLRLRLSVDLAALSSLVAIARSAEALADVASAAQLVKSEQVGAAGFAGGSSSTAIPIGRTRS